MNQGWSQLGVLKPLTWAHGLLIGAVVLGCSLLILLVRSLVRRAAERAPAHRRRAILRAAPLARLIIGVAGIAIIVPLLVSLL